MSDEAKLQTLPVQIRTMETEDLAEVLAIERAAYTHPWAEALFLGCFRPNYRNLVMTRDERVVGYALLMIGAGEGHLLNLCVSPDWRRQGYARALLLASLDEARMAKLEHVFLEVRESNQAAQQLYESEGFNEIGRRSGYYPGFNGREDARVMAKVLLGA